MATVVGIDNGNELLWVDEIYGLRSTPVNTFPLQKQIDILQGQVVALQSGIPPITYLDGGVF